MIVKRFSQMITKKDLRKILRSAINIIYNKTLPLDSAALPTQTYKVRVILFN